MKLSGDDLVTCPTCVHYRRSTRVCRNYRRAGLRTPELGLDLSRLPQRCNGHEPRPTSARSASTRETGENERTNTSP
jgi:hypothetical protein